MLRFVSLGLFFFICLPFVVHASATAGAGFVEGIWLSTSTPVAGTPVRIYVAVRNNTGSDITGHITFYDNRHAIGSSSVAAVDGRIMESWTDWKPTTGSHIITAKLTRVEAHAIGQAPMPTTIADANATSTVTVKAPPPPPPPTPSESHNTTASSSSLSSIATSTATALASVITPSAGLEQYLPPSIAKSALSAITQLTNNAKQAVDAYQAERTKPKPATTGTSSLDIPVNADGFGTVTRSSNTPAPKAEVPHDAFGNALRTIGHALSGVVTAALAITSWTLGYPALVQFILLLTILFALYQSARRVGKRRFRK